jgi:hypothetical protein
LLEKTALRPIDRPHCGISVDRIRIGRGENFRRELAAHGFPCDFIAAQSITLAACAFAE